MPDCAKPFYETNRRYSFYPRTSYHFLVKQSYMSKRAVFLDRDGVICKDRNDYVKSWDEFIWLPEAREALRRLNDNRHIAIHCDNQSVCSG